jgi:hypothetical protein
LTIHDCRLRGTFGLCRRASSGGFLGKRLLFGGQPVSAFHQLDDVDEAWGFIAADLVGFTE